MERSRVNYDFFVWLGVRTGHSSDRRNPTIEVVDERSLRFLFTDDLDGRRNHRTEITEAFKANRRHLLGSTNAYKNMRCVAARPFPFRNCVLETLTRPSCNLIDGSSIRPCQLPFQRADPEFRVGHKHSEYRRNPRLPMPYLRTAVELPLPIQ